MTKEKNEMQIVSSDSIYEATKETAIPAYLEVTMVEKVLFQRDRATRMARCAQHILDDIHEYLECEENQIYLESSNRAHVIIHHDTEFVINDLHVWNFADLQSHIRIIFIQHPDPKYPVYYFSLGTKWEVQNRVPFVVQGDVWKHDELREIAENYLYSTSNN